jgi:hypothetical protein
LLAFPTGRTRFPSGRFYAFSVFKLPLTKIPSVTKSLPNGGFARYWNLMVRPVNERFYYRKKASIIEFSHA